MKRIVCFDGSRRRLLQVCRPASAQPNRAGYCSRCGMVMNGMPDSRKSLCPECAGDDLSMRAMYMEEQKL